MLKRSQCPTGVGCRRDSIVDAESGHLYPSLVLVEWDAASGQDVCTLATRAKVGLGWIQPLMQRDGDDESIVSNFGAWKLPQCLINSEAGEVEPSVDQVGEGGCGVRKIFILQRLRSSKPTNGVYFEKESTK